MSSIGVESKRGAYGLVVSAVFGMLAVVVCVLLLRVLLGKQATQAAALTRMHSYLHWTQPFIYLGAGLMAGFADRRSGPLHAPVVGLLVASFAWLLVRRQDLLPADPALVGYMLATGVLLALLGALIAPLVQRKAAAVVIALLLLGAVSFLFALLNLGSVCGEVQQVVAERAGGGTISRQTRPVAGARVALLDEARGVELYSTVADGQGRFCMDRVPTGRYSLRAWGVGPEGGLVDTAVAVRRLIAGGTPFQTVTLSAYVREFEP